MADQKKTAWLVVIRATNPEGKPVRIQHQTRSREKMQRIINGIPSLKNLVVLNYEIWHIQHVVKVPVRRSKKCDG